MNQQIPGLPSDCLLLFLDNMECDYITSHEPQTIPLRNKKEGRAAKSTAGPRDQMDDTYLKVLYAPNTT
jgi:hypothetical protein